MTASVRPSGPTREEFAERLLKGSVKKSYAPVVDIDWDAPLEANKYFLPPRMCTLYGTALWDAMTREQQIEMSRQELVNVLSAASGLRTSSTRRCCATCCTRTPPRPAPTTR